MGYNSSSSTITLTAKLTPFGRKALVSNNTSLITSFSLGDSDANYYASVILPTGKVPAEAGEVGSNNTVNYSTTQKVNLKSVLILNGNGILKKSVEKESIIVSSEILSNGQMIISGNNITQNVINRNDFATDSLVNLYYSFGLPLNSTDDNNLTGVTYANGGFSDTSLSGLAQSNILVLGINNSTYGESLDGKQIKLDLTTSAGTYTIYSTFQNKGAKLQVEDTNYRDTSPVTAKIDDNIAFLFSDNIMTPNGGSGSLSWATGFGSIKPFSLNRKQLWNLQTNSNVAVSADTIVGIAYLDKGFLVITHPTIIEDYSTTGATGTTITFDSISTNVFQNVTCIANRGEFGGSTNPTFTGNDIPRISEIGLYDKEGNLIAIAKTDRHITKNINEFKALGIKITL
jgi:hypothetical protein